MVGIGWLFGGCLVGILGGYLCLVCLVGIFMISTPTPQISDYPECQVNLPTWSV